MKDKLLKYTLLGAILLLVACNDDGVIRKETPELTIQDEVSIGPLSERVVLNLRSTYPWFAETETEWINIRRNRGNALKPDSIILEIGENAQMTDREGYVEIRLMDQLTKRIPVTQLGRGRLITLPKKIVYFNRQGGDELVDIVTNQNWQFETIEGDGFSFTKTESGDLSIHADVNGTGNIKRQTIRLFDANQTVEETLTVMQTTQDALAAWALLPEEKDLIIQRAGNASEFLITVNDETEAKVSSDWIKVSELPAISTPGQRTDLSISVTIDENLDYDERYGYVTVASKSDPSAIADTLYITQRAADEIVYVRADAPAGGDGSSWERAYNTIAQGLTAADYAKLKELWVAKGDYQITTTLNWKEVNAFGGFNGNETKRSQRDRTQKSTIIGGPFQTMNAWSNGNGLRVFLDGFIFEGANSASEYVGTLEIYGGRGLRNCIIRNNTYGKNPGGYFDSCELINCVFYGNTSTGTTSAIVHIANGTKLYNTTIANNVGNGGAGGGLRMDAGTEAYNVLLWGNKDNRPKGSFHQLYTSENVKLYNCAIQTGDKVNVEPTKSNVIDLSPSNDASDGPQFTNPSSGSEDFSLRSGSFCIDKGLDSAIDPLNLTYDIVGNKRKSGAAVDIGAYEFPQ